MKKIIRIIKYALAFIEYNTLMDDYCGGFASLAPSWLPDWAWHEAKSKCGLTDEPNQNAPADSLALSEKWRRPPSPQTPFSRN